MSVNAQTNPNDTRHGYEIYHGSRRLSTVLHSSRKVALKLAKSFGEGVSVRRVDLTKQWQQQQRGRTKNPVRVLLHKFYAGQKLSTRSIGDHDTIYRAEVISRTPKMVTFKEEGRREIKKAKIHRMNNTEYFYPHGKYSMASIFTAEKGQRANPKKNPDAVSIFAGLAGGVASALSIYDRVSPPKKRTTMKKRGTTTAKRKNPWVDDDSKFDLGDSVTITYKTLAGTRGTVRGKVAGKSRTAADGGWEYRISGGPKGPAGQDMYFPEKLVKGKTRPARQKMLNPKPKTKNRSRNLYAMTIGSGDDIFAVILKDKDGDGFSKEFKSMSSAKAYATRSKAKVEWNPGKVLTPARKRNVDGFVDSNGVFHPIRSSEDYSPAMAGERGITKRKAATTVRSRFKKAATKKKTVSKHRATPAKAKPVRKPARSKGVAKPKAATAKRTPTQPRLFNPPKRSNGILSRALARRRAASEYKKELRLEAAAERSRLRRRKAEAKAKGNPTPKTAASKYVYIVTFKNWGMAGSIPFAEKQLAETYATHQRRTGATAVKITKRLRSRLPKINPPRPRPVKHSQRRPAYEAFQGRRSEKVYAEVPVSRHAPARLDQLGDLIELKIAGGPTLKFNGKGVRLCTARGKLWIAGKRFAKANPGTAANVVNPIGEIDHVVYGTRKPHHGDHAYTHYIHKLGEDSGKRPILCVDREGFPVIKGGNYKIEPRGIVD